MSKVDGIFISYRIPTDSTTYIGGVYEKKSDGSVTKYYGALGKTIAVRKVPAGGGQGALYYPLHDHLGSLVDVLDENGYQVQNAKTKYWPYGAVRSGGVTETDKVYTSQQIENGDSALGLYNYKARFYSTTLGRFVSADSFTTTSNPIELNRYAYTADNPVSLTDPSGRCFQWAGVMLPCSPKIALQMLDCAVSIHACEVVASASGVTFDPAEIALIHKFFSTALGRATGGDMAKTFWSNFFNPDINPYASRNRAALTFGGPDPTIAGRLLVIGEEVVTPQWQDYIGNFLLNMLNRCAVVRCANTGLKAVNFGEAAAGLFLGDPELLLLGMGLYAEDVELAWADYQLRRANGETPSLQPVWDAALSGLPGTLPPNDPEEARSLTVALLDLYGAAWCGTNSNGTVAWDTCQ